MLDARQPVLYVLGPAVRRHEHRRDLIGVVRNQLPQAAQQIAVGGGVAAFLDLVEQSDIVARIDERATIESRPSGGSCSSGMRLPIAICGGLSRSMRMVTSNGKKEVKGYASAMAGPGAILARLRRIVAIRRRARSKLKSDYDPRNPQSFVGAVNHRRKRERSGDLGAGREDKRRCCAQSDTGSAHMAHRQGQWHFALAFRNARRQAMGQDRQYRRQPHRRRAG